MSKYLSVYDRPDRFYKLSNEGQSILVNWIRENIRTEEPQLLIQTSTQIKDLITQDIFYHFSNGEVKGAMAHCGFMPINPYETEWSFYVSEKSPALNEKIRK